MTRFKKLVQALKPGQRIRLLPTIPLRHFLVMACEEKDALVLKVQLEGADGGEATSDAIELLEAHEVSCPFCTRAARHGS